MAGFPEGLAAGPKGKGCSVSSNVALTRMAVGRGIIKKDESVFASCCREAGV